MYKTRKKNIGKANKKQPKVKNSFICALKNTSTFHTKKKCPFPQRRERATQLFYQQHTHKDNNNNNNKNEKSDFK